MQARLKKVIAAAAAAVATSAGVVAATSGPASAAGLATYGITANGKQLFMFSSDDPTTFNWVRNVTGLSGDTFLVGVDFRVQDGLLYGVGNAGGVYTISIPGAVTTKVSQLSVALQGSNFGVDFNPAANRLRIVSDSGQNLRHNIDDGSTAHQTISDTWLTNVGASGTATGVSAVAYTNNDLNSDTNTTLFAINTTLDTLTIQSPPNEGKLQPVGNLGWDYNLNAGFDIYTTLQNGKAVSASGFASLPHDGITSLYVINLFTGSATLVGDFPLLAGDIAVSLTGS